MQSIAKAMALGVICSVLGGALAWSQPAGRGPSMMGGGGPGMMGQGGLGMMGGGGPGMMGGGGPGTMGAYGDPASYLDGLKSQLGISSAQEPAWKDYADTVQAAASGMQAAHQTMYAAMGTATWQERRDMMNQMMTTRQQTFETVHAAAQKLLPSLTAEQRTKAVTILPGLQPRGRGMMAGVGPRNAP